MKNPFKKDNSKKSDDGKEDTPTPEEALKMQKTTYDGEHTMPLEELLQKLETDMNSGLSEAEAAARLKRDGPNALTPPAKTPEWLKFLKVMFGGFAALLWAAAVACFVAVGIDMAQGETENMDNAYIGGALVVVVVVTGLFTYYQENKSTKIMESFDKMLPPMALVVRDGQSKELAATGLVVGDIVEIQGGVKTPADIRFVLHLLSFYLYLLLLMHAIKLLS